MVQFTIFIWGGASFVDTIERGGGGNVKYIHQCFSKCCSYESSGDDDDETEDSDCEESSDTEGEVAGLHCECTPSQIEVVDSRDHPGHSQAKEHVHAIAA